MSEQKDCFGVTYTTPTNASPTAGSRITIVNTDGTTSQGTWMGQALKN
jgi:hypothetical protein